MGLTARSVTLNVDTAETALSSLTLSANSTEGGRTITRRIALLNPSSTSETTIDLLSLQPDMAEVASNVIVKAGSSTATLRIKLASVKVSTHVTVGAVYNVVTKLASLTAMP